VSTLVWQPPDRSVDPVVVGTDRLAPFLLVPGSAAGFATNPATPELRQAPGQPGETPRSVTVRARVVTFSVAADCGSVAERVARSRELGTAFASTETPVGGVPTLGSLRLDRHDDSPVLELLALPLRLSDLRDDSQVGLPVWDVELVAPFPYWQEVNHRLVRFDGSASAGLELPADLPWDLSSATTEHVVYNPGDVPAPFVVAVYGEGTSVVLANVTTGEEIAVAGAVDPAARLEISTVFGDKRVELVDVVTGQRTTALDRYDRATSVFWRLPRGESLVRLSAAANTSIGADLVWRPRYASAEP